MATPLTTPAGKSGTFERVYVWEVPVRLYHWATAAAIAVLVATGLIIGRAPAIAVAPDASSSYWFAWARFLHITAGWVLACAFVIRVYWMFVGNTYARWYNFLPLLPAVLRKQLRQIVDVVRVDLLQLQKEPVEVLGHNAMAAWSYAAVFAATVFQIATGFALYAPMSQSMVAHAFAWVVPLMGGDANVRQWHHLATWFFVAFVLIHVYLSIFHDDVEGQGEISSMVSGVKFIKREK